MSEPIVPKTFKAIQIISIIIAVTTVLFIADCNFGPDCWDCAYKRAYCIKLVDLGVAKGPCDSLKVPEECWEKERRITQAGWDQGREDVLEKYTIKLKDLRIPKY